MADGDGFVWTSDGTGLWRLDGRNSASSTAPQVTGSRGLPRHCSAARLPPPPAEQARAGVNPPFPHPAPPFLPAQGVRDTAPLGQSDAPFAPGYGEWVRFPAAALTTGATAAGASWAAEDTCWGCGLAITSLRIFATL